MTYSETFEQAALVGIAEAARRKWVSSSTVYKAIREGRLRALVVAGRKLLREDDVAEWTPSSHGGPRRRAPHKRAGLTPREELAALMREQGTHPIMDPNELLGDFTDLIPEDIDSALRELRDAPYREWWNE